MEHDVRSESERVLERRGRERVVDDEEGPGDMTLLGALANCRGCPGDVDQLELRVGRRFEPDEPRPRRELLPQLIRPGREVDEARLRGAARSVDPLEVAVRPAVDVVA